jgi:hypothetical protein
LPECLEVLVSSTLKDKVAALRKSSPDVIKEIQLAHSPYPFTKIWAARDVAVNHFHNVKEQTPDNRYGQSMLKAVERQVTSL